MNWIEPVTLEGKFVRLEPFTLEHADAMRQHYDPVVETFMPRGAPKDTSLSAMQDYITMLNAEANRFNFAICIQNSSHVAGRISYSEVRPAHKALEKPNFIVSKGLYEMTSPLSLELRLN